MIAYVDSSLLVRAYLLDEPGHEEVRSLVEDDEIALVTGSWSRIEVSGALVRAGRGGRGGGTSSTGLLRMLDADLGDGGAIATVLAPQGEVEDVALGLVRSHGLRAMDAWHLATASLAIPPLLESREKKAFASRDLTQREVAGQLGFTLL